MKLTKYGHACVFLEKENEILVIDPGCFTKLPSEIPSIITCMIITEEHTDHFDIHNVQLILAQNPTVSIYTTAAVNQRLSVSDIQSHVVSSASTITIGNFKMTLTEIDHAPVYKNSPCKSLTVLIDDKVYYPSDSYQTIPNEVELLALPISGPWYKISESINFANQIKSSRILVTHNALNSDSGDDVAIGHIGKNLTNPQNITKLQAGECTEV